MKPVGSLSLYVPSSHYDVRPDQHHDTVTRGASKGTAIWVDVMTDVLRIQVK
jgi:hypothetical protein